MTITIPPAALEAGARAICETHCGPCRCYPDECGCVYFKAHARAACLAMLKAWPGAYGNGPRKQWKHYTPAIILPLLPQEASDE